MIEDNNKKRQREEAAALADRYCDKAGGPPKPLEIQEGLGKLGPAEYGAQRADIADALGVGLTFLDLEYKERRKAAKASADAAPETTSFLAKEPEPWPEEVDGDSVLDEIVLAVNKHLITQDGTPEVTALWAAFAHALGCFRIAPILAITSPTIECGKSTLLRLLRELTPLALPASNITSAALFRAIDRWHPTLLVDEADTFLKDDEPLRGILNSGHCRGEGVVRTIGDKHEPAYFDTFGAKAIALVGKLQPSLASRSVHIEMKRKRATEKVAELRLDRLGHLLPIKRRLARWVKDNEAALRDADPALPGAVHGRAADNWRPLVAIADTAGGEWPDRARAIATKLSVRAEDDTWGILLLQDLAKMFADLGVDRMASKVMCEKLAEVEERPWGEFKNDKPITQPKLATLLKPFGIVPGTVRFESGATAKGYYLKQLQDAISRYIPSFSAPPATAVTPSQALETKDLFKNPAVTSPPVVTAGNGQKPRNPNGCDVVTAPDHKPREEGVYDQPPPPLQNGSEAPPESCTVADDDIGVMPAFLDRRGKP